MMTLRRIFGVVILLFALFLIVSAIHVVADWGIALAMVCGALVVAFLLAAGVCLLTEGRGWPEWFR